MLYGYARVSTHHQETALQLEALKKAGITTIFQEKASSVGSRPQLRKCLLSLKKGDVLVIYKLDRIARSLKDLLAIIDQVEQAGAQIKSLTEPLDTTTPMGAFVLQILGAVAQLERSITRQRSIAGQVSAVKRGVVFGRPKAITADQEQLEPRRRADAATSCLLTATDAQASNPAAPRHCLGDFESAEASLGRDNWP